MVSASKPLLQIPLNRGGILETNAHLNLIINGEPGRSYFVESSTNLVAWTNQPYNSSVLPANGTTNLHVLALPSAQFYRVVTILY